MHLLARHLLRWALHFNEKLNPASQCVALSYIRSLEKLPVASNVSSPSFAEFIRAINRLKNAKSPGSDLDMETITFKLFEIGL